MIKLINKYKIILIIIGIIVANLWIMWYQANQKEEALLLIEEPSYVVNEAVEEVPIQEKDEKVPVYLCGEVKNPGVYYVSQKDILKTAVENAGGFLEEADETFVNLARQVVPNEKIYVPKRGEKIDKFDHSYDNSNNEEVAKLVNINQADLATLETLPGIGEVKAKQIMDYRTTQGFFKTKEEIQNVQGIGEKTYLRIEQMITTE